MKAMADSMSSVDNNKPGLEQDNKSSDLGRRLQQSAAQTDVLQPPSEAMRRLQDGVGDAAAQEDEALRQRLLTEPQLMPNVDPQALAPSRVEGSATLKVDIAAPPGTRTDVDADGLFKQTEISRIRPDGKTAVMASKTNAGHAMESASNLARQISTKHLRGAIFQTGTDGRNGRRVAVTSIQNR
jgi:hypothetical protein